MYATNGKGHTETYNSLSVSLSGQISDVYSQIQVKFILLVAKK